MPIYKLPKNISMALLANLEVVTYFGFPKKYIRFVKLWRVLYQYTVTLKYIPNNGSISQ